MREDLASNPNAERRAVGEVDRRFSAGHVLLLEEHLTLGSVHRSPITNTPLERPQVLVGETLTVRAAQLLDNCRRLQNAVLVALEQRHDLGVPDVDEDVLASPPVSRLLRLRRQRACLPSVRAARAHSGRRRGGLNSLSYSHFQPSKAEPACP
ncbi:MAG TPA: hypothetical protein VHP33_21290 [Polyangiaceae bacterium]|nr:hypothetical protein [Polyangiaceae bacterium]